MGIFSRTCQKMKSSQLGAALSRCRPDTRLPELNQQNDLVSLISAAVLCRW